MKQVANESQKTSTEMRGPRKKMGQQIVVGKDILELVSGAMYIEPLTIVREYVQNAVDAIDEAARTKSYGRKDEPRVDLFVDPQARTLRIRDNGIGISKKDFVRRLTAFGASEKRGTRARGFRGVGRLAGLGYCKELVFRSRVGGQAEISELVWDTVEFRRVLLDPRYKGDLNDVVRDVTTVYNFPAIGFPPHFFEVELRGVIRYKNDVLLNEVELNSYLGQVAPVPFHSKFLLAERITAHLAKHEVAQTYPIFINLPGKESAQVFRPYRNTFNVSASVEDAFTDVRTVEIPGIDGNVAAVGWILDHGCHGALPRAEGIKGLRLRAGNIQVGTDDILADVFPEPRFNAWTVGELHVVDPRLVPNGRRDNFEANSHFANLQAHVATLAKEITKLCRQKSELRNQEKKFRLELEKIHAKCKMLRRSSLPVTLKNQLRDEIKQHQQTLEKIIKGTVNPALRHQFERRLRKVVALLGQRLNRIDNDPLACYSRGQRQAYERVIGLIFECASNRVAASSLANKIMSKLAKAAP